MEKYEIDKVINRMVEALQVKNVSQMLKKAGLSSGLAGSWKRNGNVSDGALAKVSELSGRSITWLKTGEGPNLGPSELLRMEAPGGLEIILNQKTGGQDDLTSAEVDSIGMLITLSRRDKKRFDEVFQFIAGRYREMAEAVIAEDDKEE